MTTLLTPANASWSSAVAVWLNIQDASTLTKSGDIVTAWANRGYLGGGGTGGAGLLVDEGGFKALDVNGRAKYDFNPKNFPTAGPFTAAIAARAGTAGREAAMGWGRNASAGMFGFGRIGEYLGVTTYDRDGSRHAWPNNTNGIGVVSYVDVYHYPRFGFNGSDMFETDTAFNNGVNDFAAIGDLPQFPIPWTGYEREFVLTNRELNDEEIAELVGYLAWNNNQQGDLPANYRYKSAPPMVGGGPSLSVGSASLAITSRPINLLRGYTLPVAPTAVTVASQPLELRATRRLAIDRAALAITAGTVEPRVSRRLVIQAANLAITGQTVNALRGFTMAVQAAAIAVTARAVDLRVGRRLVTQAAAIGVTLGAVDLRVKRMLRILPTNLAVTLASVSLRLSNSLVTAPSAGRTIMLVDQGSRTVVLVDQGSRRLIL